MASINKDIGAVSAYAIAVEHGYTGTEEQWATLLANASTNAKLAADKADEASGYASTTKGYKEEAAVIKSAIDEKAKAVSQSETNVTALEKTVKGYRDTAVEKAGEATTAASTATTKASEASTSAQTATKAKDDTVSAASKALTDIANAKADGVQAIEDKTDEQLERIPEVTALESEMTNLKDMTSAEEQAGAYAMYHLGFYLDENGELCELED